LLYWLPAHGARPRRASLSCSQRRIVAARWMVPRARQPHSAEPGRFLMARSQRRLVDRIADRLQSPHQGQVRCPRWSRTSLRGAEGPAGSAGRPPSLSPCLRRWSASALARSSMEVLKAGPLARRCIRVGDLHAGGATFKTFARGVPSSSTIRRLFPSLNRRR
jgi:hypothetical protein